MSDISQQECKSAVSTENLGFRVSFSAVRTKTLLIWFTLTGLRQHKSGLI